VIRKYLPNYTGGHRGTYLTTEKLWFDPMAPNESLGQPCSVEDVLAFSQSRAVTDYRYSVRGQYATQGGINEPGGSDMGFQFSVASPAVAGTVTLTVGDPAWRLVDNVQIALSVPATREGYAAVAQRGTPGYIVNLTEGGVTQAYFVRKADVGFTPDTTPGATKLDPGIYEVQ